MTCVCVCVHVYTSELGDRDGASESDEDSLMDYKYGLPGTTPPKMSMIR